MKQLEMRSAIGALYLVADERALTGAFWKKQAVPMGRSELLLRAALEIEEYLAGRRRRFEIPIEATGTPFQKKVWAELARIPYGETRSYRDIARHIGQPRAFRAVGTANGRNPISILVPCHRVIAANGRLGGYAGGLPAKSRLLGIEGVEGVKIR